MLLKIANIMFWSGSSSYLFSLLFFSCQKPIVPISIGKKTKKAKHQVFSNSALFAFLVCKKIICSPSSFSRIFSKKLCWNFFCIKLTLLSLKHFLPNVQIRPYETIQNFYLTWNSHNRTSIAATLPSSYLQSCTIHFK